jgi:hypothetical protein
MRRVILIAALGGVLLTGTACGSDAKPARTTAAPAATTPSSAPASAAPDYAVNTKLVCGKLEKIYNDDLKGFGTQVGKMIAYKEAKQAAEATKAQLAASGELKAVAAKIEQETAAAQDPNLQAAGKTSAAKFVKSAADAKLFAGIKTTKDLDRTIDGQMTEWLTPIAGYCA